MNVIVPSCAFILAVLVFFFGNGMLLRPRLKVTCGSIDLKTPVKLKMELFMMKMMLNPEDLAGAAVNGIVQGIRESGLPEGRLRQLLGAAYDSTNLPLATLTNILSKDVPLAPYEERVVKAALAKGSVNMSSALIPDALLPESIVFFENENTGWRDARNARLVIRLNGKPYNVAFNTDNRVLAQTNGLRDFCADLEAIAPNSRTKGIIWYGPSFTPTGSPLEERGSEIVITYENGSTRQAIAVNDFFKK